MSATRRVRRLLSCAILVPAFVSAVCSEGWCQPNLAWTARLDGGFGEDNGYLIRVDAVGNVVVAGPSRNAAGDFDYLIAKYNAFGFKQWETRYAGPGNGDDTPSAMVIDGAGNVIVMGNSWGGAATADDLATLKITPDGTILWTRRYNGAASGYEGAYGFDQAGVDSAGNVYICGYSGAAGGLDEFATVKYSPTGAVLWEQRLGEPFVLGTSARAYTMAVEADGTVYVSGDGIGPGGGGDILTVKYNSAGVQQWVNAYGNPAGTGDSVYPSALDSSGNLLLAGIADTPGGLGIIAMKVAPDGTLLWTREYGTQGYAYGWGIAADAAGNVIVSGGIDTACGYDLVTLKYDAAGVPLWVRQYSSPWCGDDFPSRIAVESDGSVIVSGTTWEGFARGDDMLIVKYEADGTEAWTEAWNGAASGQDGAFDLAVDDLGQVHVSGYSLGLGTSIDMHVWKYRQTTPSLSFSPDPLQSGAAATFTATAFEPLQTAYLVYSTAGPGSTPVNVLNVVLDLASPQLIGSDVTDSAGTAEWIAFVPGIAAGVDVWFQAAQYGQTSNVLATTIN